MSNRHSSNNPQSNTLFNYFSSPITSSLSPRLNSRKRRRTADAQPQRIADDDVQPQRIARRASVPASVRNEDNIHDYVLIGPSGITELPTPERKGWELVSCPLPKQKRSRNSASPEIQRLISSPTQKQCPAQTLPCTSSSSAFQPVPRVQTKRRSTPIVEPINEVASSLILSMNKTSNDVFGIKQLNAFQCTVIKAVFDRQDSLIVVPTGAGKWMAIKRHIESLILFLVD